MTKFDTLLNPIVLIEILSPSSESCDRGGKFRRYREIESLQEYVFGLADNATSRNLRTNRRRLVAAYGSWY